MGIGIGLGAWVVLFVDSPLVDCNISLMLGADLNGVDRQVCSVTWLCLVLDANDLNWQLIVVG